MAKYNLLTYFIRQTSDKCDATRRKSIKTSEIWKISVYIRKYIINICFEMKPHPKTFNTCYFTTSVILTIKDITFRGVGISKTARRVNFF